MILIEETQKLRQRLVQLAEHPEWPLLVRYELLPQKPSPVWHQRWNHRVGRRLRVLGLNRVYYFRLRWSVSLKHAKRVTGAKTLLIWAEEVDPQQIRECCHRIQQLLAECKDWSPVLVTDVADFAFYSRLGWLVEYLPELSGEGSSYREKKRRYLAWRYRDAVVMPVAAGGLNKQQWQALLEGVE